MQIDIKDILNKHANQECIIVGSGQTMGDFDYNNFKGKIIFCGTAILRLEKVIPDYLITCNNHFPVINIKSHFDLLNKYKNMTWIFSDTGCYNDIWDFSEKIFKNFVPNYLPFDDRHFNRKECQPKQKCCQFLNLYRERKTIHEILEEKSQVKFPKKYHTSMTVAEFALMFALLMNFNKIYFQGIDLPTKKYQTKKFNKKYYGYKNEKADEFLDECLKICRKKYFFYYLKKLNFKPYLKSLKRRVNVFFNKNYSDFKEDIEKSLITFNWLSQIAKKKGVQLYNLSSASNLKLVDGIETTPR